MSTVETPVAAPPSGAQGTVRRLIVYSILFVLVVVAAAGGSGLLGRLLETRPDLGSGAGGLALSLAFALIAGPLAAVLWWFLWRRLDGPDRSSVAWGLYVSGISFVALVTSATSLLGAAADGIGGTWSPESLATGVTWLAVWLIHRAMWAHRGKGPLRLRPVPIVLGAAYGLVVGASGAIRALQSLFGEALLEPGAQLGAPWWQPALQALVWTIGGALVWWWHWRRDGARSLRGGFASVVLVVTGVLAAAAVALGGFGTALYVALRTLFDRDDPWPVVLEPLPLAVAAAAIGAVVWVYHAGVARERSAATRSAALLVEAGIGLIGAASGIGVIVNAALSAIATPLAGSSARALLLGGIAALVVGAPLWWVAWRPLHRAHAAAAGRRIYLVAVFGVSAVVAIVALLVVGYRIFELVLDGSGGSALIERIRAPFGLLLATALVAGYHFAIWRRDRAASPPVGRTRAIDRVILVSSGDTAALAAAVGAATGAAVTQWVRADGTGSAAPEAVVQALVGVEGRRVLVVTGPGDRVDVVPLAD
ncbi:DUF5671 domain-containing protein [Agrococcus sp. Ld7]|uniref:DUF5671 domain-containing protein n=1 Tax=Agrococcus sp. Ld7 TaxID=649148 RepID=UPI00386409FD